VQPRAPALASKLNGGSVISDGDPDTIAVNLRDRMCGRGHGDVGGHRYLSVVLMTAAIGITGCGRAIVTDSPVVATADPSSCSSVTFALCGPDGGTPGPNVLNATMIDSTSGWALTVDGLSITRNSGRTWTSVEPPGVISTTVLAVQFANAEDGWVVSSADGRQISVDRTADGGATWTEVRLPAAPDGRLIQAAYAEFAGSDGWIVVDAGDSASPETATMYVTTDAGASFRAGPIPTTAPVRFLNQEDGFTLGGAPHSSVYATQNGGTTWHVIGIPPASAASSVIDSGNTDQNAGESNLLAVSLRTPDSTGPSGIAVYASTSAAASFTLNGTVAFGGDASGNAVISIPDSTDVIAIAPQAAPPGMITYSSADSGRHFARATSLAKVGLDAFANATQVESASFVTARLGWAVAVYTTCFSGGMVGRADCKSNEVLFATANAGATWSSLSPP
jgi:hypothetical protein